MKELRQHLNAAVDTATMGAWLQAALQAATKKKYNVKNDSKAVYVQISSNTQIVVTPKSATTGTFSKQTKKGNNVQADPGVEYKNVSDCLSKIVQALRGKTVASRAIPETTVDEKLFELSASLKRTFIRMNQDANSLNASRRPQRLIAASDGTSSMENLETLKSALTTQGVDFLEFPAVLFNAPNSEEPGIQAILTFFDAEEDCFVSTYMDANNPGSINKTANEVISSFINGEPNAEGEETWMIEAEETDEGDVGL